MRTFNELYKQCAAKSDAAMLAGVTAEPEIVSAEELHAIRAKLPYQLEWEIFPTMDGVPLVVRG